MIKNNMGPNVPEQDILNVIGTYIKRYSLSGQTKPTAPTKKAY